MHERIPNNGVHDIAANATNHDATRWHKMNKTVVLLTYLFLGLLQPATAGVSYWHGDAPAVPLKDAVRIAEEFVKENLATEYKWRRAIIHGGSGPKGYWSFQFVAQQGERPYRDVHVSVPDGTASFGGQQYGLENLVFPRHPWTNDLAAARARLGPDQNEYYCVVAAYHADGDHWFFTFQKASPHLSWTSVAPDGNVRNFLETTPAGSTNAITELLQSLPTALSSELPYGSERISSEALQIRHAKDQYTATLPVRVFPAGFVTVQSAMLLRDGRCYLTYRVLYDRWPSGIAEQKMITWTIPLDTARDQIWVIHRPDRVIGTQHQKHR